MNVSPRLIDHRLVEAARAADILDVARRTGARLKRVTASEWVGTCPGCGGVDRFSVNVQRRVFNCRGFGGGDAIGMVRHTLGLDFVEAVEFITGEKQVQLARFRTSWQNRRFPTTKISGSSAPAGSGASQSSPEKRSSNDILPGAASN